MPLTPNADIEPTQRFQSSMSSSIALQPPVRILVQTAVPISANDVQTQLATFLEGYQARTSDTGGEGTSRGDMEGGLLAKLVQGLGHEVGK